MNAEDKMPNYKWRKIFAAYRAKSGNGDVFLTPAEQQELLDDMVKQTKRIEELEEGIKLLIYEMEYTGVTAHTNGEKEICSYHISKAQELLTKDKE